MSRRQAALCLALAFSWAVILWGAQNWLGSDYSRAQHVIFAMTALIGGVVGWIVIRRLLNLPAQPTRRDLQYVPLGALSYLIPTAMATALVLALGLGSISPQLGWGATVAEGLALLGLVVAFEAIPEELIFRGLIQASLTTLTGQWLAIPAQAALFTLWGAITGSSRTMDRMAFFFCFSLVLGILRLTTGTAATTIGFHAAFQTCAQWLSEENSWNAFSTSDPELWLAGAFTILAALIAPIIVWVAARRQRADQDQAREVEVTTARTACQRDVSPPR